MKSNKVSFFKSKSDLYLNFENNEDKFILITGISGSGKSTLASKIAAEVNGYKISFDLVFFHGAHSEKTETEYKLVDNFKKIYPDWQPSLFENLSSFEHELFFEWANKFYDFVIDYFKDINRTIVIEGGHFFRYINIDKIKGKKMIVKRTSVFCCGIRRIKRALRYYYKLFKNKKITLVRYIKNIIKDIIYIFTNQLNWKKKINVFITNFS